MSRPSEPLRQYLGSKIDTKLARIADEIDRCVLKHYYVPRAEIGRRAELRDRLDRLEEVVDEQVPLPSDAERLWELAHPSHELIRDQRQRTVCASCGARTAVGLVEKCWATRLLNVERQAGTTAAALTARGEAYEAKFRDLTERLDDLEHFLDRLEKRVQRHEPRS